jgi:hypothetical protein
MLIMMLILIFIITVASTWWFGLWSNLISLVNVLLSAMIATSFYENTSFELEQRLTSYASILPFISIWLLFALTFVFLRGLTDLLSGMRLKFDAVTELVGRSLMSIFVAGVFVGFVSFTLQMAPLRPSLFSSDVSSATAAPIGPDQLWISFVRNLSTGSLSYTVDETLFFPPYLFTQSVNSEIRLIEVRMFDPYGKFLEDRANERRTIAQRETLRTPETVAGR